ncbi:MAG TPA: heme-binding domain-containing protein [candidate division Zixibacteria bacterium]|nr:heme-binding domain-containing protein [candidate division Zixibacteria bacterium]
MMSEDNNNRRRSFRWTAIILILLVIFVWVTWPKDVDREYDFEAVEPNLDTAGLPPETQTALMTAYDEIGLHFTEVEPIFNRACYDCHSHRDKLPWYFNLPVMNGIMRDHISEGREHLDFTAGFPLRGRGAQGELLHEMEEEISEGKMPLPSYLWTHPEAKLEGAVLDSVMTWLENAQDRIAAVYTATGEPVAPPAKSVE